jgi:uncharacterized protein YutE (UPF0331/DUF86 family)
MSISTLYLERLLQTLQSATVRLNQTDEASLDYDIYRHAVIKEFELILEMCGKLLRKALKAYGGSPRDVDRLVYNDVFRRCVKHDLLDIELAERWFAYRLNRNNTAHDYGVEFVQVTLTLLPAFIEDVQTIIKQLNEQFGEVIP